MNKYLLEKLQGIGLNAMRRLPDFVVGGKDDPYLERWYIIPRNRWFNIYFHRFVRSDDDRALHDHMYASMSIILFGRYKEHLQGGKSRVLKKGDVVIRWSGKTAHRIEIYEMFPCLTLFITGPRYREWGFHCPNGWVHWKDFTNPDDPGDIGKGCGD